MPQDRQFWYFLIHGIQDETKGSFGNFYAYGSHSGEALYHAQQVALQYDIVSPYAYETTRLDTAEDWELPEDVLCFDDNVYIRPEFQTYDITEEEPMFIPPVGIIKSTDDGDYDFDLVKEGFGAYDLNEEGFYRLELCVSQHNFFSTCIHCINFLPSIDGAWLYINDPDDEDVEELWIGKNLESHKAFINFLTINKSSTIENGFIDIVAHHIPGSTNLTIDQHKVIYLTTKDESVFKLFYNGLQDLGFEQTEDFKSLQFDFYHWHYRPHNSLNTQDLIHLLEIEGFEKAAVE